MSIGPSPGTEDAASEPQSLFARLAGESLFRDRLYIMGTTAVTSLLGFAFWIVAARVLEPAEVGRAAALVSAMLFVSVFTNLGIGQVFVSRLASRTAGGEWSLTVTTGLAVVAVVSLLGGAVATVLLPTLIPALKGGLGAWAFLLLPVGVAATACSLCLDFVCIAERHAKQAFIRNSVAAVLRVAAIGIAALGPLDGATWILAIWVGSFLLIDVFAVTRTLPALGHHFEPTLAGWRGELTEMKHLIAGHQTINLGAQASTYLLPVLVSAQLGVTENAYFYTTFMLSSALFFIAPAISNALFAEGAHAPGATGRGPAAGGEVHPPPRRPPGGRPPRRRPPHPRGLRPRLLRRGRNAACDPGRRRGLRLDPAAGPGGDAGQASPHAGGHRHLADACGRDPLGMVPPPTDWGSDGAGLGWALGKVAGVLACSAFFLSWRSRAQKSRMV